MLCWRHASLLHDRQFWKDSFEHGTAHTYVAWLNMRSMSHFEAGPRTRVACHATKVKTNWRETAKPIQPGSTYPAKEYCSHCGLCDTYYVAHVKDACAFLGEGMHLMWLWQVYRAVCPVLRVHRPQTCCAMRWGVATQNLHRNVAHNLLWLDRPTTSAEHLSCNHRSGA